jgi:hypothetical protein
MSSYGLWSLVSFHMFIVLGNIASAFVLPFYAPWYIALPIIALIVNLTFAPSQCPLTRLENRIRRSLGMKEIRHFMGHYVVWPVKKRLRHNAKTVRVAEEDLVSLGVLTDGRGCVWSTRCPSCLQNTMEVIRPGEAKCVECISPQVLP